MRMVSCAVWSIPGCGRRHAVWEASSSRLGRVRSPPSISNSSRAARVPTAADDEPLPPAAFSEPLASRLPDPIRSGDLPLPACLRRPPAGAESVRRWYAVGDFTPTAGGRLLLLFSGFCAAPPAAPAVPRSAREGLGCRETFADVEPGRDPGRCGDSEDQLSAPRGRPPFHGGWFGLLPARGKVSPAAGLRRIAAPRIGAGGGGQLGWALVCGVVGAMMCTCT